MAISENLCIRKSGSPRLSGTRWSCRNTTVTAVKNTFPSTLVKKVKCRNQNDRPSSHFSQISEGIKTRVWWPPFKRRPHSKCVDYRPDLWQCFSVIIISFFFRETLHWKYSDESSVVGGRKKRLRSHGAQQILTLRLSTANSSIFIQILQQPSTLFRWLME